MTAPDDEAPDTGRPGPKKRTPAGKAPPKKPAGRRPSTKKRGNPHPERGGGAHPRIRKTDQRRKGNVELGAPLRLTPEVEKAYVSAIHAGVSRTSAAHTAGVDSATAGNWLKWGARWRQGLGRNGSGPAAPEDKVFADFHRAVTQAEAQLERDLIHPIRKSAEGEGDKTPDWRASLELLRRRFREDWADKIEVHTTHEDAEPEADRIADAVLNDPTLAADLTEALGRITTNLTEPKGSKPKDVKA